MEATLQTPTVPAVLLALREATHDFHKRVEKRTPFFRPEFDRPAYVRWLDLMHGFYAPIDAAVKDSAFSACTGWNYQPRCELLTRDTALLADRAPLQPTDPEGVLGGIRALTRTGEIAGMLYVVEGSALGGKVLLKALERSAGVTAVAGASFFAPHGSEPQTAWADYVRLLTHGSASPAFEADAVAGAVTTFRSLHDWIGQGWRG